ncbi:unnamed protein product [Adineta steineri]|uniref:Uncharacterized protein n=1 Tax=Adineta steineri TaxID=433720 RepID=A0A814LXM9_9BILA|nr:unnamed protein product [Adineta steineri]CAF3634911.1 unnamed protein product [Adineta steineri]
MKYSLRKSFSYRRRKEKHDDLNLVKPVKSKSFLQRQRRCSSSSPPPPQSTALPHSSSSEKVKSKVFEPRYDIYSNNDDGDDDENDDPFSSSKKTRIRPLDRLTNQIRKSFRNTLTRPRPRLESTNSNKRLIFNKNDENSIQHAPLYPQLSTGLTSPLIMSNENEKIKTSKKQRKAPLAPTTHMNQSISLPNEINSKQQQQQSDYDISYNDQKIENSKQNLEKTPFNRSIRTRLSLLLKKRHDTPPQHEEIHNEDSNQKLTIGQRFNTLRRSFHIGNRNPSQKGKRYLLSNE